MVHKATIVEPTPTEIKRIDKLKQIYGKNGATYCTRHSCPYNRDSGKCLIYPENCCCFQLVGEPFVCKLEYLKGRHVAFRTELNPDLVPEMVNLSEYDEFNEGTQSPIYRPVERIICPFLPYVTKGANLSCVQRIYFDV